MQLLHNDHLVHTAGCKKGTRRAGDAGHLRPLAPSPSLFFFCFVIWRLGDLATGGYGSLPSLSLLLSSLSSPCLLLHDCTRFLFGQGGVIGNRSLPCLIRLTTPPFSSSPWAFRMFGPVSFLFGQVYEHTRARAPCERDEQTADKQK